MQTDALDRLDALPLGDHAALCVFDPAWHQGVIGILAGRIKERYHRPAIVFALSEQGELKGSGRSISDVHLRDVLDLVSKRHPGLIRKFGGHAMAAGLTIGPDDLPLFQTALDEAVRTLTGRSQFDKLVEIDGTLESGYFHPEVARMLDHHVWGSGFPAPLFADRFQVLSQRLIKEKHLKLNLGLGTLRLDGIAFNCTDALPSVAHLAFRICADEYNGVSKISVVVEQILEV